MGFLQYLKFVVVTIFENLNNNSLIVKSNLILPILFFCPYDRICIFLVCSLTNLLLGLFKQNFGSFLAILVGGFYSKLFIRFCTC